MSTFLLHNGRAIGTNSNPQPDPTPYETYTRPSEWISLPTVSPGDEIYHLLVAVFPDGSNNLGFRIAGDFNVDWGDGFSSGYTANHPTTTNDRTTYNIQYSGVSSATTTSYGYRQAIVTVTPQSGNTLTLFDIDEVPFAGTDYGNLYNGVLDVRMSSPNLTTLDIGGYSPMLEQFELVGPHSITSTVSSFNGSSVSKIVAFEFSGVTDTGSMFTSCVNLIELPDIMDVSNCTELDGMFYGCTSLERIP